VRPRELRLLPTHTRERRRLEELLLAGAAALLLAAEWWLERQLKERP